MPLKEVHPDRVYLLDCPDCGKLGAHSVTHLMQSVVKAGPKGYQLSWGWACKDCHKARGFKLLWQEGKLYVEWGELNKEREGQRNWVVLKLAGKILNPNDKLADDVYLVLDSDLNPSAYWYNEHTCPTNWLRDVDEIYLFNEKSERVESDPHGLFQFVGWLPHDGKDYTSSPNPHTERWREIMEKIRKGEPTPLLPADDFERYVQD